jgi:hypothetical protein
LVSPCCSESWQLCSLLVILLWSWLISACLLRDYVFPSPTFPGARSRSCILSDHNALKLELKNKNKGKKHANSWRLNKSLLNEQWVIDEIKKVIKTFLEVNENENTTYWNLWDTGKAVLRGKFISVSAYVKKTERSQINDLMIHLKLLEKQEQANPKTSIRRERIKIKAEVNEIETKKPYKEIMKQKVSSLKK